MLIDFIYGKVKSLPVYCLALLCAACSTSIPMTKGDLEHVKTAGIVNNFPPKPLYTITGSIGFDDDFGHIPSNEYKKKIEQLVVERLQKRGIKIRPVVKNDKQSQSSVDLLIELIPQTIHGGPGIKHGYGINQQSFLGARGTAVVYVSLFVTWHINGASKGSTFFRTHIEHEDVGKLPSKWDELTIDQKTKIENALNAVIEKTVSKTLNDVGI